ncbi:hypothetical protein [Bradyrhizobium genosp. P]|uniref:hypothetical protein n=1 Tax=Bradyrhizobium genosp. P TaxID=83641 RepID=UPI003CF6EFE5
MTKRNTENLTAICDKLMDNPSMRAAARHVGISLSTMWSWLGASQKAQPGDTTDFLIEFMGDTVLFHEAVGMARKAAVAEIEALFTHRMMRGTVEKVFYKGHPTWVEDESLINVDDETLVILGLPDRFKRDEYGNRIQHTIVHAPPVAGVLATLAAHHPKMWGSHQNIEVNNRASGVSIVKHTYERPAPPPIPVQEVPMISQHVPTLEEELGLDSLDSDDAIEAAPVEEVASAPAPEPAPKPSTPLPTKPMTPLLADLLQRWKEKQASLAQGATPPVVRPAPAPQSSRYDDPEEGIGDEPRPGGVRVK